MKKSIFYTAAAFLSGLVFSFGLILSEMINPAKVQGFLDVFGDWDPSLMFVLGGAIPVAFVAVRLMKSMSKPVLSESFDLPVKAQIDRPLIIGSAIFGIGWGLGGLCPAPAIASLSIGVEAAVFFVVAMVIGMIAHDKLWVKMK